MNKTLRIILFAVGSLLLAFILVVAGAAFDRFVLGGLNFSAARMGRFSQSSNAPGMMPGGGNGFFGGEKMGRGWNNNGNNQGSAPDVNRGNDNCGCGNNNAQPGNNNPGNNGQNNRGGNTPWNQTRGMGPGMMGPGWGNSAPGTQNNQGTTTPLSVEDAKTAIQSYITGLKNDDLVLGEVMVFSNNVYGEILEKSTGIGAMEVLVDPTTKTVSPEMGPNMMWNLKYGSMQGMMGGFRRGGMMGGITNNSRSADEKMTVTSEQAVNNAQKYLDANFQGYKADEKPQAFYGYYTLDYTKDGKTVGMLSVNGFSGEVFLHFWHGTFIESSGE